MAHIEKSERLRSLLNNRDFREMSVIGEIDAAKGERGKYMSLAKTAFNILYCMAGCDGVLDEREREIILDFLERHGTYLGRMDFEPQQAVSELTARSDDEEERGKFFFSELESLKFFTGVSLRWAMLDAAAEIAATDGTITDGERSLFQTMAAKWEINLPDFVRRRTAEANAPFEKNARENFYSWSLGRQIALDALALLRFDDGRIEPHFEKAKKAAAELGVTVNRMTGITPNHLGNTAIVALYLLVDEGARVSTQIDCFHGVTAAAHFKLIVDCYRLLLFYDNRHDTNQTFLNTILTRKAQTAIPDEYFQPLVSAVRENVDIFVFKKIFEDFDVATNNFLYKRFKVLPTAPAEPPAEPTLTLTTTGISYVNMPLPAAPPAAGLSERVNQGNLFAWTLGSLFAVYAIAEAHLNAEVSDSYFQKAKMAAGAMNLEINPLVKMSKDLTENYARLLEYFFKDEGIRLAAKMDEIYGAPVSDYFKIVAQCYLMLLMYDPSPTGRVLAETALTQALSRRHQTVIPEAYFEQLIGAVKRGVHLELLQAIVTDFDESVSKFLFDPPAPPASPAPPAAKSSRKTEQGNFFAWELGRWLSLYALAEASLNSGLAAEHFEKAQIAAGGMGLGINPLTGMTGDLRTNQILMIVYLLNQEGLRLANEMDAKYGTMVSAYFYIIVKAYNLLLMIAPETYLDGILSLKPHTDIPDAFFQPITSAIRQAVKYEVLNPIVAEFNRSISTFLYNRMNGEKNSVEQNVLPENHQTNEFKSAPQTAAATPNSSETLSAPLQILSAYGQGRAGNDEVLRSLISHRGWFAPLEMFYQGEKKISWVFNDERNIKAGELWLFTDHESVIRAEDAGASIGSYGGTFSGTELFGKIPADIKSIHVNPGSPREKTWSFFDESSVELARLWSEVIALEEKIEQWQPDKPDLTALNRVFITFINAATYEVFLIKEFSAEMRIAVPVFTASDSADKFLKSLPPEKSAELKQIKINGHQLLNDLPNMKIEMPNNQPPTSIDGAIINAYGPGAFYILRFSDILSGT